MPRVINASVRDWWDVFDTYAHRTALTLASGFHPVVGVDSPLLRAAKDCPKGDKSPAETVIGNVLGYALDEPAVRYRVQELRHPLHVEHPLRLTEPRFYGHWRCDNPRCSAGRHSMYRAWESDQFRCDLCDFDLCADCVNASLTSIVQQPS